MLNRLTSRGRRTLNKPVGCDIVEGDALSADNSLLLQQGRSHAKDRMRWAILKTEQPRWWIGDLATHMFGTMFTASEIDLAQNYKLAPVVPQSQAIRGFWPRHLPPLHLPASIIYFQGAMLHSQSTRSTSFAGLCLMGGRWRL